MTTCVHDHERFVRGWGSEDRLGAEHLPPIVTRGVLLDLCALDGGESLDAGRSMGRDDLERARDGTGVEIREGDVVCLHTGWGRVFTRDHARYVSGERSARPAREALNP